MIKNKLRNMWSEVLVVLIMKSTILWEITLRRMSSYGM
jgi:hypothetical protein